MMNAEEIQVRLDRTAPSWTVTEDGKALTRTYQLPGFRAAIAFVEYLAELAEAADHHPDLDIRYSKVKVTLSTHSEGGVTEKDFDLIAQIDHA